MSSETYTVTVSWGARIERLADVSRRLGEYLHMLRSLHADFSAWQTYVPAAGGFSPACDGWADLSRHWDAARSIIDGETRDDVEELGPDGAATGVTWSRHGFELYLFGAAPGAPASADADADGAYLEIHAGGQFRNEIALSISASRADAANYGWMRKLLLATAAHWMGDKGAVHSPGFVTVNLESRELPVGQVNASWLAFLRNPYLAACIRPVDACRTELQDDDGILFSLCEHVPDPADARDVARARAVVAWLDGFHFHHAWTVYGWPYDPADAVYAHQVTGAPEGTVYAVAFVPFDGYDAVRKVLLYTRLFRLRNRQGLDLDPTYRDDRKALESLPYVVQARQHIAAVRYVGADNPIEWHVGIEQNARALKVLLNEWAAIPETQLRVVYTPYEGELAPFTAPG
jgi:hypothetical protein